MDTTNLSASSILFALPAVPILLLHTFARAHVVLRPRWTRFFMLSAQVIAAVVVVTIAIRPSLVRFVVALFVPHLQWVIVRLLYSRFIEIHGRSPLDVFLSSQDLENTAADRMFLFVGYVTLGIAPFLVFGVLEIVEFMLFTVFAMFQRLQ